jgi:hypothetical protein
MQEIISPIYKINQVLINLSSSKLIENKQSEGSKYYMYYFDEDPNIFENIFYPLIESMNEKQLEHLAEILSPGEKQILLSIPESLLLFKTVCIFQIAPESHEQNVLELNCFERIIKSYKHQAFFELLSFISIDKKLFIRSGESWLWLSFSSLRETKKNSNTINI